MIKPKIIVVYDVPNWGGYERAKMFKKYTQDIFDVTLTSEEEFNKNYEAHFRDYDLYYLSYHTMLARGNFSERLPKNKIITMVTGRSVLKEIFNHGKNDNGEKLEAKKYWNILTKPCVAIFANNLFAFRELKNYYSGMKYYTPRGVDSDLFKPTEPYNTDNEFRTCFVGKPVEEKGISFIKEVTRKSGSVLLKNTRNWTDALPLDRMSKFYSKCNVYLVASTIDGTPNPMLEAAACERPIIANQIGNVPQFIKNGVNGFLVDLDENEYVRKIKWLQEHPKEAEEMGKKARETVLTSWTWKYSIKQEEKAIKEILGIHNKNNA